MRTSTLLALACCALLPASDSAARATLAPLSGAQAPPRALGMRRLRGGAEAGAPSCDDATPCIGALQDFAPLEEFYGTGDSNAVFRRKLQDLKGQYHLGYRPVKGDGNCFIRGYVFGLLEDLLSKPASEAAGFRGAWPAPAGRAAAAAAPAAPVRASVRLRRRSGLSRCGRRACCVQVSSWRTTSPSSTRKMAWATAQPRSRTFTTT